MQGHDPVFEAKEQVTNRFLLCVVAFERAKQLIRGARSRTDRKFHNPVTTALAEIAEQKVHAPGDEPEIGLPETPETSDGA